MITEDVLNSKSHDEGNYDVDRLDYILRDHTYNGTRIENYSHEQYTRKFAKLDKDGNIIKNDDGSIVLLEAQEEQGSIPKKQIDVYENSSLNTIENFLETRVQAYKNMYYSEPIQVRDSLVGIFVNCVLQEKDDVAKELKDFIRELKEKDTQIDLSKYLKWDDIRFYTNCLDIAENSNNQNIRDFSGVVIPNLLKLMVLTFSYLDLKTARANKYSNVGEYDKNFIKRIKGLIYSDSDVSKMLKNRDYYKENCFRSYDAKNIEELKKHFGDAIQYSNATVWAYKSNTPIYVKDKNGKVFALHEHPDRACDWEKRREDMSVAFVAKPFLKLQGYNDEQIQEIIRNFSVEFTDSCSEVKKKINMSPIKVDSKLDEYFEL